MVVPNSPFRVQKYSFKFKTLFTVMLLAPFSLALCTSNVSTAHAQGVSLSTFPSTLRLQAQPPEDIRAGFTVKNQTAETVKLDIMLKPFKADAANDGKVLYVEGNDPPILKQTQVVDDGFAVSSIELGPKQSKQLELHINLNEKEPISDYYFSVIMLAAEPEAPDETPNEVTAYSIAQAGIAMNVLLAVGPKEQPLGYLEDFSTPVYRDSGPVPFTVKVANRGPHYFTPKGVVLIKNIFGQTVGRLDIQNANILAGTSRSLTSIPYTQSANTNPSKSSDLSTLPTQYLSQYAVWPEEFLLGFYTADLSIALSEDGPVLNQTIRFAAFPAKLLMATGVIITLILLIIYRVRKKLRDS